MSELPETSVSPPSSSPAEVNASPVAPTPIAPVENGFVALGLAPELIQAITAMGYTQPTVVQNRVIPRALAHLLGSISGAATPSSQTPVPGATEASTSTSISNKPHFVDLMVSSQTGSGKTAAFLLPMLHTLLIQQQHAPAAVPAQSANVGGGRPQRGGDRWNNRDNRGGHGGGRRFGPATPQALVLCPTRELAQQVASDAIEMVRSCRGLRVASVIGGLPYAQQISRLQGANLVVATPGRLLDLCQSQQLQLDQVQFLVVDEADRMLDLGFAEDLQNIHELTSNRRQTLMFSATFAPRIMDLATQVMRKPERIQIDSPHEKHQNIRQVLHWADDPSHRRQLLNHWLKDKALDQAVVFVSTQVECDGLAENLIEEGFSAVALHGALSQGLRNRRLRMVREGEAKILVATDVAARGLDVPAITHVVNYGLPMKAEDYTHRIGRTGRAGRDGTAITIAQGYDRRRVLDIERHTQQRLTPEVIAGLEPQKRWDMGRPPREGGGGFGGGRSGGGGFGGGGRNGGFGARSPGFGGGGGGFGARRPVLGAGMTAEGRPFSNDRPPRWEQAGRGDRPDRVQRFGRSSGPSSHGGASYAERPGHGGYTGHPNPARRHSANPSAHNPGGPRFSHHGDGHSR
jgi:superfamily II DNA/RNA helicase